MEHCRHSAFSALNYSRGANLSLYFAREILSIVPGKGRNCLGREISGPVPVKVAAG